MSERNGDRARFSKERGRKIVRRQRVRELRKTLVVKGKALGTAPTG